MKINDNSNWVDHRVRYSDTDRMDMVYHGSYIPMLEAARVDTLREVGWVYAVMEKEGVLLPVIDLQLKYIKPARYDQILTIETHVLGSPTSSIIFQFKILHEDKLLVEAEVRLAFISSETGRARRAPEGLEASLRDRGLIH
jgi:acyl-CoA thioester hydrolase